MSSSPISRSDFLYNFFHPKSKQLSDHDKKVYQNLHIILGCTTLGLGHALLGIVYLIQSSCLKTEKIQKKAQEILRPIEAEIIPQTSDLLFEDNVRHLRKGIMHCIEYLEHETTLDKLESVSFLTIVNGEKTRDAYHKDKDFECTRNDFMKFIEGKILEQKRLDSLFKENQNTSISFMMNTREEGLSPALSIKTHLFYHDGKFSKEHKPRIYNH